MIKRVVKLIKLSIFLFVFMVAASRVVMVEAAELPAENTQEQEIDANPENEKEEENVVLQQIEQIGNTAEEGGKQAKNLTLSALAQMIRIVPYIGIVLFLVGIFLAVFSTRNKGNRRMGIKMAVTEAVIVYVVYIALVLTYDLAYGNGIVQFASRPIQADRYEEVYFNVLQDLKNDGESFLFLGADWISSLAVAGRRMYVSVVWLLIYACVSAGLLIFFVTKRDKAIRRFAVVGLCIILPTALFIGYQFLRI